MRALAAATGSYEEVEDALQTTFISALRRDPADLASPEGWVFIVALNRLRRLRRRAALQRLIGPQVQRQPSAEEAVLDRLDLARALRRLRPRERELLVAKYYLGMSQEEMATAFGLPRGTVSAALSRAAARLRAMEAPHVQG